MKKVNTIFISIMILFISVKTLPQEVDSPEITVDELKSHIEYLASDELEGRKPGTKGLEKAAGYIMQQLKKVNAVPLGNNYFQNLDIVADLKFGDNNGFSFNEFEGILNEDYTPISISENGSVTAPFVFAGYGFQIDRDSLKWDDYSDVETEGKWVIILRGSPAGDGHSDPYADYSSLRKKILTARDNKAAGVILVSGVSFDQSDKLMELTFSRRESSAGLPAIHVKRDVINKLLMPAGITVEDLEKNLSENLAPASFQVDMEISGKVDIEKITEQTYNVTALIEGSDPLLKDEYIVIGAHFDHLGLGGPGSGSRTPDTVAVHNGADDNASGTSAIIEIFEKLAADKNNLKRSIIFVAFTAEEMGLIGSKYFVENPLVDLSRIKFMFNLDMVGRLDPDTRNLTVGGSGTAIGLEDMLKKHTAVSGLNVKFNSEGYGPSDHASFYAKDIPVAFLFTGVHEDYHTPRDDAGLINYEGEKLVADLVYNMIVDIANLSEALVYQEAGPKEMPTTSRRFKVTLGIMPDVASSDVKGVRADAVMEGRPAYNAGMQKGDIIVAMDGKDVNDIYDYMNRLSEFKEGQRISVDVMRGDKKVILIVEL
ncbi:MAG: M20/M25/M40 family metallo-hydrolase [Melioribacteraceae bacterium]|nr:M20/M25/M40 family metallo-hydrolase [Melioribacteraceae bacterium]